MHTRVEIITLRLLRSSVIALAFAVPLSNELLDRLDSGHRTLAVVSLWTLWAVLLLSILVPASSSLTALRLAAPAHLASLVLVAAVAGLDVGSSIALAASAIVAALSSSGETGAYFVQSSAYGDERRFPLRCPRPFLAVIVIAWIVWFAAAAVGSILLTAGSIIGAIPAAFAVIGFVFLPRRFHRYSRRWLVEVPSGLVVHDYVILTETAMFPRRVVAGVDAWSRSQDPEHEPFDLSGGLGSAAITIRLTGPETIILAPTKDHPGGRAFHITSARVCPTRIGRTIAMLNSKR